MTTAQIQKIEKMVTESTVFAKKAIRKSNELEAYLSLMQYRFGNVAEHKSVKTLFKKIKL